MDSVWVQDFRCFSGNNEAPLRPLTLLVGENSTGKTSFMAMIRALWDVAYNNKVPNFRESPYDLGNFEDIAHTSGTKQKQHFLGGFSAKGPRGAKLRIEVRFERQGTYPMPVSRTVRDQSAMVRATQRHPGSQLVATFETGEAKWSRNLSKNWIANDESLMPMFLIGVMLATDEKASRSVDSKALRKVRELLNYPLGPFQSSSTRPFASAPVRSKPKRTYEASRPARDPEGDYIPSYLAETYRVGGEAWASLKAKLEEYGGESGLFDELRVQDSDLDGFPFQVQVRKKAKDANGPWRNLIDMGYGLSQVLPLITELFRPDALPMSLLQQPEVHLHPKAQAALGTFYCRMAESDRQLVVETHSDHLLNRVRMDIRDGKTQLTSDDVSILYFERSGPGVNIHPLRIDEDGSVSAPDSYSSFFMEEVNRQLGIAHGD